MKRKTIILWTLLFCLIFFTQCEKRHEGVCVGTYSFTDQDKKIIPFQNNDICILLDSLGIDSLEFHVDTIIDYNDYWYTTDPYEGQQSDIEYKDYYSIEDYSVYASGSFSVNMRFIDPLNPPVKKRLSFSFDIESHPDIAKFEGYCYFDNTTFYQNDYTPANLKLFTTMYDSLSINNKMFYFVYEFKQSIPPSGTTISITKLYFVFGKGLVGIKTNNSKTWSLM
jgi:hypothetical protein